MARCATRCTCSPLATRRLAAGARDIDRRPAWVAAWGLSTAALAGTAGGTASVRSSAARRSSSAARAGAPGRKIRAALAIDTGTLQAALQHHRCGWLRRSYRLRLTDFIGCARGCLQRRSRGVRTPSVRRLRVRPSPALLDPCGRGGVSVCSGARALKTGAALLTEASQLPDHQDGKTA